MTNLEGADLQWANLERADLQGASLFEANLRGAALEGAKLKGAALEGSNLRGAALEGAILGDDIKVTNHPQPVFSVGPMETIQRPLLAFHTNRGILIGTYGFFGGLDEFTATLVAKHGTTEVGQKYQLAVRLIEKHFGFWPPG
jgi:hypothetical protein